MKAGSTSDVVHTFATVLVTSLRDELEETRRNHSQIRTQDEQEILSLKARLARREAEIARCTCLPGHIRSQEIDRLSLMTTTRHVSPFLRNSKKRSPFKPKPDLLTESEIWNILELGAARDRALELEVSTLKEMVWIHVHMELVLLTDATST